MYTTGLPTSSCTSSISTSECKRCFMTKLFTQAPNSRSSIFESEKQEEYRRKTLDPAFKGVLLDYRMEILMWNKRHLNSTLTICQENFLSVHSVFLAKKNFYGLPTINEKVEQLKYSGLTRRLIKKKLNFKLPGNERGPTALTIRQLAGIFQVLFGGIVLASLALLIELCKHSRFRRTLNHVWK